MLLNQVDRKYRKWDNDVTHFIMSCMKIFTWLLDTYFRFISKNAYIMCAMHSKSFCTSARDAFYLTMRNVLRVVSLGTVTTFVFATMKILLATGMGTLSFFFFKSKLFGSSLHHIAVPVSFVALGTYFIAGVFFKVYTMAIDTLFLCFCTYHMYIVWKCLFWTFFFINFLRIQIQSFFQFETNIFSGRLWAERWFGRKTIFHVQEFDEHSRKEKSNCTTTIW